MLPRLSELQVRNLALIEHAHISLSGGLNVITGETGAGKTMLARALDLLLGAKTPKNSVRPGADAAYVEGVFELPERWSSRLNDDELAELVGSDTEVVLGRRIAASGRSRCLINGQTVSAETLRDLASHLIAFYGQHEQRRLMLDHAQMALLDRSGDGEGVKLHARYVAAREEAVHAAREVQRLAAQQDTSARELDLARFELAELNDVGLQEGEEAQLMEELRVLESADAGRFACATAHTALAGAEFDDTGATVLVADAASALSDLGIKETDELNARLESVRIELADIADEVQQLGERWEADPSRQAHVQSRLETFHRLERKHQCDFAGLFTVLTQLQRTVDAADERPQLLAAAEQRAEHALADARAAASALSAWRAKQAPKLAKAVCATLGELAMEQAKFAVELNGWDAEGLAALRESGAENVVFTLQANPGLPAEELSQVASGGEASRLMLALISQVTDTDGGLLVLDEPDAGLGGQTAHGVAARLKALSKRQQVLVISHLPQIAARADLHLRLHKQTDETTTRTQIEPLLDDEMIVDELCRLAGHPADDGAARQAMTKLRG